MKKVSKNKKSSMWSIDEFGFISTPKHYFNIRDVNGIFLHNKIELEIMISNTKLTIKSNEEDALLGIFEWLKEAMKASHKALQEQYNQRLKPMDEMVKIMKKGCK